MGSLIGIEVAGRHLQAVGWESLQMGVPPREGVDEPGSMGVLPAMVRLVLDNEVGRVGAIVIGTGASKVTEPGPDFGMTEAAFTHQYLLDHIDDLDRFPAIGRHPGYTTLDDRQVVQRKLEAALLADQSKNTAEELTEASGIFNDRGIQLVTQVTNGNHGPRCMNEVVKAKGLGLIGPDQVWSVTTDDRDFGGHATAIFEYPHRGDDPMLNTDFDGFRPGEIFPAIYKLAPEERLTVLRQMRALLESSGAIPSLHQDEDQTPA